MFKRVQPPKLGLVWHRDKLLLLGTEAFVRIDSDALLASESAWMAALAQAAASLLAKQRQKTISLYLPGQYFIGSRLKLPGVPLAALNGAIQLQLDSILPGQDQALLSKVAQQLESNGDYQILCFAGTLADAIYQAFALQGIRVQLILPRALLVLSGRNPCVQILDQDEQGQTLLQWQQGRMLRWAYISNEDLSEAAFAQEWQDLQQMQVDCEPQQLRHLQDWQSQKASTAKIYQYAFVPPLDLAQVVAKKHRSKRLGVYAVISFLLLSISIAAWALWRYEARIDAELATLKNVTADIRQLRDGVFTIEDKLAAIDNFPDQHIDNILLVLNELLPKDSWLIQFDIKKGVLTLEGYSPNPTELLNKLAELPEFSQVAFNKPISSGTGAGGTDRFGISLNINNVDVAGYVQTYYTQGE